MKARYRLFLRRKSVYYAFDTTTRKFQSLDAKDRKEAERLTATLNEAAKQPAMNLRLARVYLQHSDPAFSCRTWQHVMDEAARMKTGDTQKCWRRAMREKPFDLIRNLPIIETRPEHFIAMFACGKVCTNIFSRRLHNFAFDMNWLPAPVLVRKHWPKIRFKEKRAITAAEHAKILAGERSPEWHAFYQVLWHTGGAQSDIRSTVRTETRNNSASSNRVTQGCAALAFPSSALIFGVVMFLVRYGGRPQGPTCKRKDGHFGRP